MPLLLLAQPELELLALAPSEGLLPPEAELEALSALEAVKPEAEGEAEEKLDAEGLPVEEEESSRLLVMVWVSVLVMRMV